MEDYWLKSRISQRGYANSKAGGAKILFWQFFSPKTAWNWKKKDPKRLDSVCCVSLASFMSESSGNNRIVRGRGGRIYHICHIWNGILWLKTAVWTALNDIACIIRLALSLWKNAAFRMTFAVLNVSFAISRTACLFFTWHVCYGLERLLEVEYLSLRRRSLRRLPVRSISGTTPLNNPEGRPTELSRLGTAAGRLSRSRKRDPSCFCCSASIRLVLMSTSVEPHLHGNQCSLTSLRNTANRLFKTSQQVRGFWKLILTFQDSRFKFFYCSVNAHGYNV